MKVALVSVSSNEQYDLQKAMDNAGLNTVFTETNINKLVEVIDFIDADVIVLNIDEQNDIPDELLNDLLDKASIPVVFNHFDSVNEFDQNDAEMHFVRLLKKMVSSVASNKENRLLNSADTKFVPADEEALATPRYKRDELARNIWLLGASLGGPEALKQFLAVLPTNLPVAFVLTQHLGQGFIPGLVRQLDRVTAFKVLSPVAGHVLRHGEVLVTPVGYRLRINPIGAVELTPLEEQFPYSPSVDMIMNDFVERYPKTSNAIIFSGMCSDGVAGSKSVANKKGEVWVQSSETCVVPAMPENVAAVVKVNFTGAPVELATKLVDKYM